MRKQQFLAGSFSALGMFLLILDGKTALTAAQTGIDLCIRTVIPALFPFLILSAMLTSSFSGFQFPGSRCFTHLLYIPRGCESIVISGFLGGYPVGAQAVASAYHAGKLKRTDAEYLLSFCCNAGPAFLFGIAGSSFSDKNTALLLWGIHICSALLTAECIPKPPASPMVRRDSKPVSLSEAMSRSLQAMGCVCGWIILFRVIFAFLNRWFLWMLPPVLQTAAGGILELSNGCLELTRIPDIRTRFILCSGMLAWGGMCVTLQTVSILRDLPVAPYLKGKFLQTLFSLILSTAAVLHILFPVLVFLVLLTGILEFPRKRSGNPGVSGV